MTNGNDLLSILFYNNRLQPCRISVKSSGTAPGSCSDATNVGNVMDYTYAFNSGVANNGNVASIANNINTARSQTYTYDELNRISTAKTQATTGTYAWGLSFGYDAWANLLSQSVTQGSAYTLSTSATNKSQLSGYSYDSAGNMTADATNTYTYDAESHLLTAAGVTYTYDGDGNRVKKSSGKLYWRGAGSDSLDETDSSGTLTDEYIFFGGKRIARRDSSNNVDYYFADHLGTAHVVTNASGTIQDDSDFYPFGGERPYLSSSGNAYKFTGKERDTESGLDDFGARYYSSGLGRFVSADWSATPEPVPYADFTDPQSLNLYTYVRDVPTARVDGDGHCCDRQQMEQIGNIPTDVAMGAAKAAWNGLAGLFNQTIGKLVDLAKGGDGNGKILPEATAKNTAEKVGEVAGSVAMIVVPVAGEASAAFEVGEAADLSEAASTEGNTLTRYMGEGEAATARETGSIPNTDPLGKPKDVHFTTEPPTNDASTAQQRYELQQTPTHRATVPTSRAGKLDPAPGGPQTSGGGSQVVTKQKVPVKPSEIHPLNHP